MISYVHHQTSRYVALILLGWGMQYEIVSLTLLLSEEQLSGAGGIPPFFPNRDARPPL